MGDIEQALSWLKEAAEVRFVRDDEINLTLIKWNALIDPVLNRPEFVEVRKQLLNFGD